MLPPRPSAWWASTRRYCSRSPGLTRISVGGVTRLVAMSVNRPQPASSASNGMARLRGVIAWPNVSPLVEATSVDRLDRDRRQVDALQATDIDTPYILGCPRTPEWKNAAARAEIVLRDLRVPLVQR